MKRATFIFLIAFSLLYAPRLYAQQPLTKTVSFRVVNKPVDTLLAIISRQSQCSFSFAGSPFRGDSLVTFTVTRKPVKQVLDLLFGGRIQYVESGDNIILQRAEQHRERNYVISGYVRDRENGQGIPNASIYDHTNLASTFTNNEGFFHLRLKDKGRQPSIQLTVSKEFYNDTALYVLPGFDREISVAIAPAKTVVLKEFIVSDQVEKTWLGRRLLSEGLRRQTQNISKFFADKPVQTSLVPAIGSHGKMAGQVVNKFSLNLVGGYSAGLNGVEIAGGFNIDKKDVQYAQVAGIFNMVGGRMNGAQATGGYNHVMQSVTGVQAAGIANVANGALNGAQATGGLNTVGDSAKGAQAAGISNMVKGNLEGVQATGGLNQVGGDVLGAQASGISNFNQRNTTGASITGGLNYTSGDMVGLQLAGVSNVAGGGINGLQLSGVGNYSRDVYGLQLSGIGNYSGNVQGVQFSGIGNIAHGHMAGLQLGQIFNYSRRLTGVQFALINVADTSSGLSIGLLNIIRKGGYYKLSVDANDIMPLNLTFKSGRKQFYTLLTGGMDNDMYNVGFGIGRSFTIRRNMAITTDLMQLNVFDKDWKSLAQVYRFQPQFNFSITKWFSIHAGPAISITEYAGGFNKFAGQNEKNWLGWQAGISFF